MTIYLLDVNLLLAIHDRGHEHHETAIGWFGAFSAEGWATCPLTESGFVRIASNPKYPRMNGNPDVLARVLEQTCLSETHEFWADALSPLDILRPNIPITFNQITDIYLVALALEHGGKLATLDRSIPAHLFPGGADALHVIQP